MSTNSSNSAQLFLLNSQQDYLHILQNGEYHSIHNQATGISDRITVADGGIITDVGGVRSSTSLFIDVVVLDAQPAGR